MVVAEFQIFNPGYDVQCDQCSRVEAGVILRKVGDPRNFGALCTRCLALALQAATGWNVLSQYTLWKANSELGKQIKKDMRRAYNQET